MCWPLWQEVGLAFFWKDEVYLRICDSSTGFVDAVIESHDPAKRWRLTGFYGHPKASQRKHSWQLPIEDYATSQTYHGSVSVIIMKFCTLVKRQGRKIEHRV